MECPSESRTLIALPKASNTFEHITYPNCVNDLAKLLLRQIGARKTVGKLAKT
jgi:hypothetical protein